MSRVLILRRLPWLACSLLALASRPARAQNPAAAEALFEQARAAMAAGSYSIACARFRDSDKLDPAVGTRFNLADCEERRGRLATAWSLFRGVVAELAQNDDRRPIAEQRAASLKPRVPSVTLVRGAGTPPGMRVRVDGVELGEGSFGVALPMDPGTHELILVPPEGSGPPRSSSFALREGEQKQLPIQIDAVAAVSTEQDEASRADTGAGAGARRRWGYIVGGAGIGGVLFGAVTGVVTLNKKSTADANCNESTQTCNPAGKAANDSGKTYAALSSIGFGVGAIGLAAGTYLVLTSPADLEPAAHSSVPVPRLTPELTLSTGGGFFSVAGNF